MYFRVSSASFLKPMMYIVSSPSTGDISSGGEQGLLGLAFALGTGAVDPPRRHDGRGEDQRRKPCQPDHHHHKIAYALHRMDLGGYRHVPIIDDDERLAGVISIRGILAYLTERQLTNAQSGDDQADAVVSVSVPLGDMFKFGASGARLSRGGFGDNLNLGIENYNKDVWAARASVEVTRGRGRSPRGRRRTRAAEARQTGQPLQARALVQAGLVLRFGCPLLRESIGLITRCLQLRDAFAVLRQQRVQRRLNVVDIDAGERWQFVGFKQHIGHGIYQLRHW